MTLRELMNQIERTNGKKLPTAAWLRVGNSPLTVEKRISENCCLSVYQNGFALYQTPVHGVPGGLLRRLYLFRTGTGKLLFRGLLCRGRMVGSSGDGG